ncbi:unnamed protein product [Prunus brigantina]
MFTLIKCIQFIQKKIHNFLTIYIFFFMTIFYLFKKMSAF